MYSTSGSFWAIGSQVHALAQVIHRLEVLAPAGVDDLEDHEALELPHQLGPELGLLLRVRLLGVLGEVVDERLPLEPAAKVLAQLLGADVGAVERVHRLAQLVEIPALARVGREQVSVARSTTSSIHCAHLAGQVVALRARVGAARR